MWRPRGLRPQQLAIEPQPERALVRLDEATANGDLHEAWKGGVGYLCVYITSLQDESCSNSLSSSQ
jgi:hypothetical protein